MLSRFFNRNMFPNVNAYLLLLFFCACGYSVCVNRLAKLVFAAVAYVCGYDGNFLLKHIHDEYVVHGLLFYHTYFGAV